MLTDPAGQASFDEFLDQAQWVEVIGADEIRTAAAAWLPADQYIEVRTLPRDPPFGLHFGWTGSPKPSRKRGGGTAGRQRMLAGVTERWLTSTSSPARTS